MPLFMELSASVGRYHAPLSRMVYLGKAPRGTERAAEIAAIGLDAIRTALRPGAVSGEVYAAWQQVIDDGLGHARHRRHHCGYAVGIGFPPSWVGGSAAYVVSLKHPHLRDPRGHAELRTCGVEQRASRRRCRQHA
jgi:Xaa-Pro dipeptidase